MRDAFRNFEDAENFVKQRVEKICERKKISVGKVFIFLVL